MLATEHNLVIPISKRMLHDRIDDLSTLGQVLAQCHNEMNYYITMAGLWRVI